MCEKFEYSKDNKKFVEVDFGENSSELASSLTRLEGIEAELARLEAETKKIEAKRKELAQKIAATIEAVCGEDCKSVCGKNGRKFGIVRRERQDTDWRGMAEYFQPSPEIREKFKKEPQKTVYYQYTPAKY